MSYRDGHQIPYDKKELALLQTHSVIRTEGLHSFPPPPCQASKHADAKKKKKKNETV